MSPSQDLRELPVALIEPNLSQPRRCFDEEALETLADSVRERGVLQPVLVRPVENGRYQLVAGERRWRAAQLAGLQTITALISEYDDLAALEAGLIENMAREDLNPVEEARACSTLVKELGLSYRQLGERVGRNHVTVFNLMRLLDLSEEIIELLERGELSKSHGTALLVAEDPQARGALARKAVEEGWPKRVLEDRVRQSNLTGSLDAAHGQDEDPEPPLDQTAMNVARVWGDAVGAEVTVRTMARGKLRVEFVFDSPEGAFALGGQIAEQIARGSKRR